MTAQVRVPDVDLVELGIVAKVEQVEQEEALCT